MTRIQIYEYSDRLSFLIDKENGIILNNQVLHFDEDNLDNYIRNNENLQHSRCENIMFKESERKSCLNDILKSQDFNYIQRLKEYCTNINLNNINITKKKEHSPSKEKGINNSNNLDITNPLYN